jgi:Bacteriocin-protection, YdeI or OmpD-Associated/Domain of unknown function (DUF1905)
VPTFRTTVEREGTTARFLRVPPDVVTELGTRKRPPVRVTVGRHTFRSTVAVYGDDFFLPLNAANRASAAVGAGDVVDVTIELDEEPRVVAIPEDLAEALAADSGAAAAFDDLSYSHQREFVEWIDEAKRAETRTRRIAGTVERLADGRTAP